MNSPRQHPRVKRTSCFVLSLVFLQQDCRKPRSIHDERNYLFVFVHGRTRYTLLVCLLRGTTAIPAIHALTCCFSGVLSTPPADSGRQDVFHFMYQVWKKHYIGRRRKVHWRFISGSPAIQAPPGPALVRNSSGHYPGSMKDFNCTARLVQFKHNIAPNLLSIQSLFSPFFREDP